MKTLATLLFLLSGSVFASTPPGGTWQAVSATTAYAPLTSTAIAAFWPSTRTTFTFPAPWNTTGVRITLPSDCPSSDNCIMNLGYAYWANMSNSAGSPYMYIFVGRNADGGVNGVGIYKYNKDRDIVTYEGAMTINTSNSGEGWFFSRNDPDTIIMAPPGKVGTTLQSYNVVTGQTNNLFSLSNWTNIPTVGASTGAMFGQCSANLYDTIYACTLADASFTAMGCMTYNTKSQEFRFFQQASPGGFDECAISPDGRYLLVDEVTPQTCSSGCDEDTIVYDLQEPGRSYIINNKYGGGGHYAIGYGWYVQSDNWNLSNSAVRLFDFSDPHGSKSGKDIIEIPYANICPGGTCYASIPQHPSWLNAKPGSEMPVSDQYVCDSSAGTSSDTPVPFGNQISCYYTSGGVAQANQKVLLVAPTMMNTAKIGGCGSSSYDLQPKANIDYTGHYVIWAANLDSSTNCQVMLVKLPISQFSNPPPDVTPPQASILTPAPAATVSGTESLTAAAWDNISLNGVQWYVDGAKVGSVITSAPYTYSLSITSLASGPHTISAMAIDSAGNESSLSTIVVVK